MPKPITRRSFGVTVTLACGAVHRPRNGRLAGDGLGFVRIGRDDDAKFAAIGRDRRQARLERLSRRGDKRPRVGAAGGDGAGESPLARLPRSRVGSKTRTIQPGART